MLVPSSISSPFSKICPAVDLPFYPTFPAFKDKISLMFNTISAANGLDCLTSNNLCGICNYVNAANFQIGENVALY